MLKTPILCLLFLLVLSPGAPAADEKPGPTGPQVDGPFHKVVLDADRDIDGDGKIDDVLADVMELAVAADGRVFFIERAGTIKVWKPATKATTLIGKIEVFTGLEDGLLGIALDPNFIENGWIYLFHSEPATYQEE